MSEWQSTNELRWLKNQTRGKAYSDMNCLVVCQRQYRRENGWEDTSCPVTGFVHDIAIQAYEYKWVDEI